MRGAAAANPQRERRAVEKSNLTEGFLDLRGRKNLLERSLRSGCEVGGWMKMLIMMLVDIHRDSSDTCVVYPMTQRKAKWAFDTGFYPSSSPPPSKPCRQTQEC